MLPATDEIVLHRVAMRGTGSAVESARAPLRTALEHADWPSTPPGEMLFLRRISGSGAARASAAHAAAQARFLAGSAVDGWSAAAPDAQAVHFRSHASLLACLIRDLLCGNARRNWYWRRWHGALRRPTDEALVALLLEEPLSLPTVVTQLRSTTVWQPFWQSLGGDSGERLLAATARAAGWSATVQAARACLTAHVALAEEAIPAEATPPFELTFLSAARDDPRPLLAALLTLWQYAPASLSQASGARQLQRLSQAINGEPPATPERQDKQRMAMPDPGFTFPDSTTLHPGYSTAAAPHPAHAACGASMADEPDKTSGTAAPVQHEALHATSAYGAKDSAAAAMTENIAPIQENGAHADAMPRIETGARESAVPPEMEPSDTAESLPSGELCRHDFITRQGGLFYLLNFLNLPTVQAQLFAADNTMSQPGAGWRCFYQLAAALGCPPEGELLAFLVSECALKNGSALAQQPPGQMDQLLRLGENRYGAEVWQAATWQLPARLIASASHVDLHFRLNDVRLPVRRTGLDINPGWLPWLGRVVTFHYGSGREPP